MDGVKKTSSMDVLRLIRDCAEALLLLPIQPALVSMRVCAPLFILSCTRLWAAISSADMLPVPPLLNALIPGTSAADDDSWKLNDGLISITPCCVTITGT